MQEALAGSSADREQTHPDLVAMVSHDMRTPLAAIKEAVSLLSETASGQLDECQRRYLVVAREEIDRLNRMIDNLVEVSRLDSGRTALHIDAVDLRDVLSDAVESLTPLAAKHNLTIERNISPDLPPVWGDRDRLRRVFGNLFDNAIRHSPPGGTIRVAAEPAAPGSSMPPGQGISGDTRYVLVTVADSGPGIPADSLERVFNRFEQLDRHGPGVGLGLAIVRSIVEMHHGRVWAENSPGGGAVFRLALPTRKNS